MCKAHRFANDFSHELLTRFTINDIHIHIIDFFIIQKEINNFFIIIFGELPTTYIEVGISCRLPDTVHTLSLSGRLIVIYIYYWK